MDTSTEYPQLRLFEKKKHNIFQIALSKLDFQLPINASVLCLVNKHF